MSEQQTSPAAVPVEQIPEWEAARARVLARVPDAVWLESGGIYGRGTLDGKKHLLGSGDDCCEAWIDADRRLAAVPEPKAEPCSRCDGRGIVGREYGEDSCSACNGTGVRQSSAGVEERGGESAADVLRDILADGRYFSHNPQWPDFESLPECPAGHEYECGDCHMRRRAEAAVQPSPASPAAAGGEAGVITDYGAMGLKSCPFCGNRNGFVIKNAPALQPIQCLDCGAIGPVPILGKGSASAWNMRGGVKEEEG